MARPHRGLGQGRAAVGPEGGDAHQERAWGRAPQRGTPEGPEGGWSAARGALGALAIVAISNGNDSVQTSKHLSESAVISYISSL